MNNQNKHQNNQLLKRLGFKIYDERQLRAVIGMNFQEFTELAKVFHRALYEHFASKPRIRAVGGGKRGVLGGFDESSAARRLLAVLIWLKAYPTYDVFGFILGIRRNTAHKAIVLNLEILEKALGRKFVLPERKINSVEEFMEKFPGVRDIFIDGSERPIEKPKDQRKRKKVYSGKKKRTTRKHIIVVDEKERILILTKSKTGRRHDKKLAERAGLFDVIPLLVHIWLDTGFLGILKHPKIPPKNVHIPTKATKCHKLTKEEKGENRIVSHFRVVAEHAIGHVKRYRAASDIWRAKTGGADDKVMLIASGLWNFHISQRQVV